MLHKTEPIFNSGYYQRGITEKCNMLSYLHYDIYLRVITYKWIFTTNFNKELTTCIKHFSSFSIRTVRYLVLRYWDSREAYEINSHDTRKHYIPWDSLSTEINEHCTGVKHNDMTTCRMENKRLTQTKHFFILYEYFSKN